MGKRQSWDEYFMNIALAVSSRSTCLRSKVGAVLVDKDRLIVSTGYNGPPRGCESCGEAGCIRLKLGVKSGERTEFCRGSHAETNALIFAKTPTEGASLYVTRFPCIQCVKNLINAGVRTVYFLPDENKNELALRLLEEAGVKLVEMELSGHCGEPSPVFDADRQSPA